MKNKLVPPVALHASRDAIILSDEKNVVPKVWKFLDKIQEFSEPVHSGTRVGDLKDVAANGCLEWGLSLDMIVAFATHHLLPLSLGASWLMDIEPLWALGGWSFLSNCMAQPNSSSSSPIFSQHFSKSSTFLQFLTLFFILLLLINLSHQPNPSTTMASSETFKPSKSSTSSTTTMHHPHNSQNSHSTPSSSSSSKYAHGKEFGADAHEVPSGPNPISN
ncbi:hypothetical protein RJT34_15831 [Clitoria ternatea]|uniref:Uncharacterized protein n=1 Tax=Clitoria ternatea TaxID=43366 RepID=A0AAN9J6D6_CLITE